MNDAIRIQCLRNIGDQFNESYINPHIELTMPSILAFSEEPHVEALWKTRACAFLLKSGVKKTELVKEWVDLATKDDDILYNPPTPHPLPRDNMNRWKNGHYLG